MDMILMPVPGHIFVTGNHLGVNRQSRRLVIIVPLGDPLHCGHDKNADHKRKYHKKYQLKGFESKPKKTSGHPLLISVCAYCPRKLSFCPDVRDNGNISPSGPKHPRGSYPHWPQNTTRGLRFVTFFRS